MEEGKDAIVNYEQRDPWRRHGRKGEMGTIIPEVHSSHDGVRRCGFIRCISVTIWPSWKTNKKIMSSVEGKCPKASLACSEQQGLWASGPRLGDCRIPPPPLPQSVLPISTWQQHQSDLPLPVPCAPCCWAGHQVRREENAPSNSLGDCASVPPKPHHPGCRSQEAALTHHQHQPAELSLERSPEPSCCCLSPLSTQASLPKPSLFSSATKENLISC